MTRRVDVQEHGVAGKSNEALQQIEEHLDAVQDLVKQLNSLEAFVQISKMMKNLLEDVQIPAKLSDVHLGPPALLSVSTLKPSEVIENGLVNLSQASLYRAVQQRRFYNVTPNGRSIGAVYPAWQFVEPVPELIGPILRILEDQPSSEIHAFWVCSCDELNELSPAEMLAGKPYESRGVLESSQLRYLNLPTSSRVDKVISVARLFTKGMVDIIG